VDSLTYCSPDGDFIPNPTQQFLRDLIFQRGQDYFDSGCGAGSLKVLRHTPGSIEVLRDQPMLEFFFLDPYGFFFECHTMAAQLGLLVPYDGSGRMEVVWHYYGGEPMPVPVACCVPRDRAWEIVQEFCRTRGCSPSVRWVKQSELDLPWEEWGLA
jgi:hypothetical protein